MSETIINDIKAKGFITNYCVKVTNSTTANPNKELSATQITKIRNLTCDILKILREQAHTQKFSKVIIKNRASQIILKLVQEDGTSKKILYNTDNKLAKKYLSLTKTVNEQIQKHAYFHTKTTSSDLSFPCCSHNKITIQSSLPRSKYEMVFSQLNKNALLNIDENLEILKKYYKEKNSHLVEKTLTTLETINEYNAFERILKKRDTFKEYKKNISKNFSKFQNELRLALMSFDTMQEISPQEKVCKNILETLCFVLFTEITIPYEDMQDIYHQSTGHEATTSPTNFAEVSDLLEKDRIDISTKKKATFKTMINRALQAISLKEFDPIKKNTPYIRSRQIFEQHLLEPGSILKTLDLQNPQKTSKKTITYLRHGTPTRQKSKLKSEYSSIILPEYIGFLNYLKNHEQKVMYTNHQRHLPHNFNLVHEETRRNAIADIEKNKDYKEKHTFNFMSFSVCDIPLLEPYPGYGSKKKINPKSLSPFFKEQSIDNFKKSLIYSIINKEHNIQLPQAFTEKNIVNLKGILGNVFENIFELYFSAADKKTLFEKAPTDPEKIEKIQALILIYFVYLKNIIKLDIDIDFILSACKSDVDRGNMIKTFEEAIYLIMENKENPKNLQDLLYQTALPPLIKEKRAIQKKNLDILRTGIKHLGSLSDEQKQQIRNGGFFNWKLVENSIPNMPLA